MFDHIRFNWFRAGVSTKIETIQNLDTRTVALLKKMILEWPQERPLTQFLFDLWRDKTLRKQSKYVVGAIASCVIACHNTRAAYNSNNGTTNSIRLDFVLSIEENTHKIIRILSDIYPEHAQHAEIFDFIKTAYGRWLELVEHDLDCKETSELIF